MKDVVTEKNQYLNTKIVNLAPSQAESLGSSLLMWECLKDLCLCLYYVHADF